MRRAELQKTLDELLDCGRFADYCPNGLQVEGRDTVRRILCGVTASQALVEAAIEREADAIVVHHGWFWRGEDGRVTGWRRQRLARLLAHDINLFGYHLPLDAHPELGNNAQLARALGWEVEGACATQPLVLLGHLPQPMPAAELARSVAARLAREPLLVGNGERLVSRVAWCTGGAQAYFEHAINAGAELYLSGEISEQTTHLARETGVPYLAAGHHATERYGIRALAAWLSGNSDLEVDFLDLDNPV
ncbi:MAG: Nif3-like dinuclear metal center hexameric protein [Candidatus Dactylopiibacterium carminicum]|uniref:GTP cyclohydrolase 1 type 2 homolog n=1 Tax=Candidatus Dactylopiibacterium carminicum TaxID=857335 RepID=A0A272ENB7_9RHOO|nr:Nif3-like dinuclear metal center hexameric protein [Candidatus Dactylopiibacterium carminicum]KAF7598033.1 Nif3-like dinuclear metal center hexameric protein [Candidatus Dactylopiibacterium carminicum]PAS91615.1 MAG: Nif3-like dinuclear metal center hexameric protein [Candidatus Dactylopiibacterium carminicum]PAS93533.1 MAG: Nif3-like dinuclear metal center hexameric protein [Candidatus Dactylopiibacterium carminicum]PAS96381.1 MAG: Nif3-like dinuclear metal center hexameric protein [Candida